ncbi:MAG: STAS domain-containing protein [Planctomycetes bacterium]|nr:STAS domain-containing protein [Planctomycetota bacterium]
MAVLEIALERKAGAVIVRLKGAVDTSTVEDLERSLSTLSGGGQNTVVVDLAAVDYVNSRGMALLIKYNDIFTQHKGTFAISSLNNRVKPTFELMGLLEALFVVDKPEDVFETPKPPEPEPEPAASPSHDVSCPNCSAVLPVDSPGYFKCSRCGTIIKVAKNFKARTALGKDADIVSIAIPMLPRYVSAVRAGLESLAAHYLQDQRTLWPAVDEILGFLVDRAAKKKKRYAMSVDMVADESGFAVVMTIPKGVSIMDDQFKAHPGYNVAAKVFKTVEVHGLKPGGQAVVLKK